jgi:phosphoadenosine phosphosulfate reductase
MLIENTLFGIRNKVEISLTRIKEFEIMALQNNPAGYYVCISGGKDSSVIQQLCILARVKCQFVHNHTSVDCPETVYFIKSEKKRLESMGYIFNIEIPRFRDGRQKTMWNGIITKGLPLRNQRWCCERLKEFGGDDRYVITGVRWAESPRRANSRAVHEISGDTKQQHIILNNDNDMKRKLTEYCLQRQRFVLNPIVDWTDDDVWEFLKIQKVPVNPLYEKGNKRVGCIGCPMSESRKELEKYPKYKSMYYKAAEKHIKHRKAQGLPDKPIMKDVETYFTWWLNG